LLTSKIVKTCYYLEGVLRFCSTKDSSVVFTFLFWPLSRCIFVHPQIGKIERIFERKTVDKALFIKTAVQTLCQRPTLGFHGLLSWREFHPKNKALLVRVKCRRCLFLEETYFCTPQKLESVSTLVPRYSVYIKNTWRCSYCNDQLVIKE
jgi:hypothetical protein